MDFLVEIKRKQWRVWFDESIPMLQGLTLRQAARTKQGQRLLDDLLVFYDQNRNAARAPNSIDANVPTKWAKWKLGYGPGSADEFVEEEAIFNAVDPRQATQRKEQHTAKLDKKKKRVYIPCRCECPGCTDESVNNVKSCARCNAVWYCSREHQVQDYPRHKLECKFLSKRNDLDFKSYSTPKELELYPLGSPPQVTNDSRCFICHSHADEVHLGRTPCCNLPVCDNGFEYEWHSYSRDHCKRSHVHYTKCYTHCEEGHDGDWRECKLCNVMDDGNVRPFAMTNGFNYSPALQENIPRGSFVTMPCTGCKNRILQGQDVFSSTEKGMFCSKCIDEGCSPYAHSSYVY